MQIQKAGKTIAALSVVAVLCAGAAIVAQASPLGPAEGVSRPSPGAIARDVASGSGVENEENHEAAEYARHHSLTLQEAMKALEFQNAITSVRDEGAGGGEFSGSVNGELRAAAGDALAGIWLEQGRTPTMVVLVRGEPTAELTGLAERWAERLGGRIEVRGGAKHTASELARALSDVDWDGLIPGFAGVSSDEKKGEIVVHSTSAQSGPLGSVRSVHDAAAVPLPEKVRELGDINVRVESGGPAMPADMKG
ncbi:MAG: hypothetical protein QM708_15330 [Propioniciclava sp.]|uniref:hypothetical protein n=1 Tax=Propioniciclava sp. TaxID=2038686 RepID=UPI0039E21B0E